MNQWYCYVGSQRYGPADENTLRQWIAQGRVGPTNLVWRQGMPEWVEIRLVPELMSYHVLSPDSLVPAPSPGGSQGRSGTWKLISESWNSLGNRWGLAIGFAVLIFLIHTGVNIVGKAIPLIGGIASLVVSGPLFLGAVVFYLTYSRRGPASLDMLFAGFKNFGHALAAFLLVAIFVLLWTLLFGIPAIVIGIAVAVSEGSLPSGARMPGAVYAFGYIALIPPVVAGAVAQLMYSQTFYFLAEDRTLGALEAIRRSRGIMRGHKVRLSYMLLFFGLFSIPCIFTLGIGLLWVTPLIGMSLARFYDDLKPHAETAAQPSPQPTPDEFGPSIYSPM